MMGKTLGELSQEFNCTKLTISRNLKKNLGENKYKELTVKNKVIEDKNMNFIKGISVENNIDNIQEYPIKKFEDQLSKTPFIEIAPLNYQVDNTYQKELASIPITEVEFPRMVYMIVDKKVELEIKYLGDYPNWNFLSKDELERKTIEIYSDLKIAKSFCGKDQKVIKVPNTDVFKIAAPILLSRGISRIVSSDQLISL